MFVTAIDKAGEYTRALHTIIRYFGSQDVHPGAATLFFVNDQGWALTCKHVAAEIVNADPLLAKATAFRQAAATIPAGARQSRQRQALAAQHGFGQGVP